VLALAGCSSDGGSSSDKAASSTTASRTTARKDLPVQQLVLPADQFPAGFQVQEIPESQLQQMTDQILASTKGAKVSPASCAQLNLVPDHFDVSKVGLAVATKGTETLGTSVVAGPQTTMAQQRASATGKCQHLTMEFASGPAQGAKGEVNQKVVKAPKTKADDAMVVEQTTVISVAGKTQTMKSRVGLALVDGYQVSVQGSSMTGQAVDEATFDDVFAKAVNRVAEKAG
ncbi:hypothetical protein, partial [Gordonia sp. (in: high G+C Gram-positive bacteria)]|uniref:hypothetical protein n=1 Tax=Gordonia sp. (in: high G+C Gram-positive bacteria) TaxID=84139 RepID=UPI00260748C8